MADSDPDAEARELMVKAAPLLKAVGAAPPEPRRTGHAPPVRVAVALVRSFLPDEIKTVAREGSDQFSGG